MKRDLVQEFLEEPTLQRYKANKRLIMKRLNLMTASDKFYYLFRIGKNPGPKEMLISAAIIRNEKVFDLIREGKIDPSKYLKGNDYDIFKYRYNGNSTDPFITLGYSDGRHGESSLYNVMLENVIEHYTDEERMKKLEIRIRDGDHIINRQIILDLICVAGKQNNTSLIAILIEQYNK